MIALRITVAYTSNGTVYLEDFHNFHTKRRVGPFALMITDEPRNFIRN